MAGVADYVDESIEVLSTWDGDALQCLDWIRDRSARLEIDATSELCAFEVSHCPAVGQLKASASLIPRVESNSLGALILAVDIWRWLGGDRQPTRALEIVRTARVEYARSLLSDLLYELIRSKPAFSYGERSLDPEETINVIRSCEWSSADRIARSPRGQWWSVQSAGFNFYDWLANTSRLNPSIHAFQDRAPGNALELPISVQEMLAGIALTWLDEALVNSSKTIGLLCEVGQALQECGFEQGCEAGKEMAEEDAESPASAFGRIGAAARHASNRSEKERVIEVYKSGNYPSKDAAAFQLAEKVVGAKFRTVRDWLKGV